MSTDKCDKFNAAIDGVYDEIMADFQEAGFLIVYYNKSENRFSSFVGGSAENLQMAFINLLVAKDFHMVPLAMACLSIAMREQLKAKQRAND